MQQNRDKKTDVAYEVDIGLDFVEFHVANHVEYIILHQNSKGIIFSCNRN
jgi:hypothetical protein